MVAIEVPNKLEGKEGEVVRFEVSFGFDDAGDIIIRIGEAEAVVGALELTLVLQLVAVE